MKCPICGKENGCGHLVAYIDLKACTIQKGSLKDQLRDQMKSKTEGRLDRREVIREIVKKLKKISGKGMWEMHKSRYYEEYWFWAKESEKARTLYFSKDNTQKPGFGDFKLTPVNIEAYNQVMPPPDDSLVSKEEKEEMELEQRRAKAQALGYPNWAQYFYAKGLLEEFLEYALNGGQKPKLGGPGINVDFKHLLKTSDILFSLKNTGQVTDQEIKNYFFPEDDSTPFDNNIIERNKPKGDGAENHGPYLPPGV
jgi:hypothetical protein